MKLSYAVHDLMLPSEPLRMPMFGAARDFLLTAALLPGLSASARMTAVDIDQQPWRGLLRVQTELGGRCTGVLVAPSVAMTAAHCLFVVRTGRFVQPGSVHVLLGYRLGRMKAHARVRQFIIPSGYDPRREPADAGLDRAVLLLEHPIAPARDLAAISTTIPRAGLPIRLAGFGEDHDEVALEGPACRVTTITRDRAGHRLIIHDCAGTRGTSGAPLFARAPYGAWQVVGLQIEARIGVAGGVAVPIPTGTASDR